MFSINKDVQTHSLFKSIKITGISNSTTGNMKNVKTLTGKMVPPAG